MKKRTILPLGCFLVFFLSACGDDGAGPESGPHPIQTGRWSATTDFGVFEIVVDAPDSDNVSEIVYRLSQFSCGSTVSVSGSVTVRSSSGWPITDRSFGIENDLNPDPFGSDEAINITGVFGSSGNDASGSWSADWHGRTCSGSWSGAPM